MSTLLQSVILGVAAAVGWGIADFTAAVVAKRLGILRTAIGIHLASVLVTTAILLAAFDIGSLSIAHWLLLLAVAAIGFVTYLAFYKALQVGPVAVVSPIVSTYAVVVILLAMVFASERLSAGQAIGASASIGGVVLASANFRGLGNGGRLLSTGVVFAIAATLGIGLWQYFIGILSREIGWFLPIYVSRLLTLLFLIPTSVAVREKPWRWFSLPMVVAVAAVGIVETGGLFAFARGTEIGVISIVAAASITYPLIPILGGLLIFKERLGATQVAGLTIALVGLLVLALNT